MNTRLSCDQTLAFLESVSDVGALNAILRALEPVANRECNFSLMSAVRNIREERDRLAGKLTELGRLP